MIEKISFVMGMMLLAVMVLVLALFGWVNGYPWWRRKELQKR